MCCHTHRTVDYGIIDIWIIIENLLKTRNILTRREEFQIRLTLQTLDLSATIQHHYHTQILQPSPNVIAVPTRVGPEVQWLADFPQAELLHRQRNHMW